MSKPEPLTLGASAACCPLSEGPLAAPQALEIAKMFKALGDPVRLRLLSMVASTAEACVCDLTGPFELSQPTISHHLKVLREASLVDCERRGTWVYYRARPESLQRLSALLNATAVEPA